MNIKTADITSYLQLKRLICLWTIGLSAIFGCRNSNDPTKMDDAKQEQDKFSFQLDSTTTKAEIQKIVEKLDEKSAIKFFDFYYPQVSDPGAYVTVNKEKEIFKLELANHGWSSDWKIIDMDSLISYIYKNREYNEGEIRIVARLKCTVEVQTDEGIVITPMFYKLKDKW